MRPVLPCKGPLLHTKPVQLLYTAIHIGHLLRKMSKRERHTTGGIPRWSPTLVLVARFSAYVWQSGRDAQFSLTYGRMCYVGLL
jgi:hypothetical protein